MASSYSTDLKLELMATGENSGTWGTKTNTNLNLIQQAIAGYEAISIAGGAQTTALAMTNATISNARNAVIKFTGTITGNQIVTIPDSIEKVYIIENATSGAYTVQFKTVSGTGITWAATDKGHRILYADGTNVVDSETITQDAIQTLNNKTLESPKIGTGLLDANGAESIKFTATGSAVNEITVVNAATGNDPAINATGDDSNIDLNLVAKGTGVVQSNGNAVKVAGKETIWIPASAMYPTTTNGCANLEQVELTAGQPELKCLDFDASSDENAQFAVAFPKSWDPSQLLMYQVYWTGNSTNTGNVIWNLKGVACADDDAIDAAFGTGVDVTDAHSGTANDLDVTAQSASVTVAGSPAADEEVFFNISRDADSGSDTFTADARLLGIKLFFATNLPNDA
tara:strand:- start:263 stop:1462 length:1200 start_codon:yes stop_codon:yes gene_type:complete